MAFRSPRLDHFGEGVPCCIDRALGDTAAENGLLNHLALREPAVEVGLKHIDPLFFLLVERYIALDCFPLLYS